MNGIGLDTWGVDFGLLDEHDQLLSNPRHYRDARTEGMLEAAFARVPRAEIFGYTGIQFMEINTLYQLLAMRIQGDATLDRARTLLMMPDLFNYWLTGVKASEFCIASTSQMYDPQARGWADALLDRMDLPTDILQPIIQPGAEIGGLLPTVGAEVGLGSIPVIAPGCHDTACAVAAVPAQSAEFAYLSSGTWSLMGIEVPEPVISDDSLAYNFTNEGGVEGTIRLLKNIVGLWLVQECRRTWAAQGEKLSYDDLSLLAEKAPGLRYLVDPDHHTFLRPGDMPIRIREYCAGTGQQVPQARGEIIRCALDSLALRYRWTLEKLDLMRGIRHSTIHIVGGGCQNHLLCQLAADSTGRDVIAGPIEATATGNILMQAIARGDISSVSEARAVVRQSFDLVHYAPHQ